MVDVRGRIPSLSISADTRAFLIIGFVIFLMVLSAAAFAAGVGTFVLMMIKMNVLGVMASSLLLAVGGAGLAGTYLWVAE